jgi:hypothetical protein
MIRHSFGLLSALALAGCAIAPPRVPYTPADLAEGQVIDGDPVRFWAKGDDQAYSVWRSRCWHSVRPPRCLCPARYWLCRGIRQGGLFCRVLNAWSRQGGRPSFDIVTGVSTGSLIAPFAFLGEQEDGELKAIYTGVSRKDIYHQHPQRPVWRPQPYVDPAVAGADRTPHHTGFARPHCSAASAWPQVAGDDHNLDAERGVIWDMGAIAASGTPDRLSLFRQVLLASASIPVFPPVLIHSEAHGHRFAEMHVDGGTVSGISCSRAQC